jgi:hypothetical protein
LRRHEILNFYVEKSLFKGARYFTASGIQQGKSREGLAGQKKNKQPIKIVMATRGSRREGEDGREKKDSLSVFLFLESHKSPKKAASCLSVGTRSADLNIQSYVLRKVH